MAEHIDFEQPVHSNSTTPIPDGHFVAQSNHDMYTRKLEDDILRLTHAGFGLRFLAYILDLLLIGAIKGIIISPIINIGGLQNVYVWIPLFSVEHILSTIIYFSYFVIMTYCFSATLGKMIIGLKVMSIKNEKLTMSTVLTRELFGRYINNFFLSLLYLVVLFNPKKRGIHDMLSDTFVVKEDKEYIRQFILKEGIR
ncbi:RDD family protein [Macrococcus capreoli]